MAKIEPIPILAFPLKGKGQAQGQAQRLTRRNKPRYSCSMRDLLATTTTTTTRLRVRTGVSS
jgi:hypothetical protein